MSESVSVAAITLPTLPFEHTIETRRFTFRTNKELGTKRPPLTLQYPRITWNGFAHLVSAEDTEEEKARSQRAVEFVMSLIGDYTEGVVRGLINDADNPVNSQEDLSKLLNDLVFEKLIFTSDADRRGAKISDEAWKAFAEDYTTVVTKVAPNRTANQIKQALELFLKKVMPVKTNKQVLERLQGLLAEWYNASEAQEEHSEIYEFLSERIRRFLNVEDKNYLDALG